MAEPADLNPAFFLLTARSANVKNSVGIKNDGGVQDGKAWCAVCILRSGWRSGTIGASPLVSRYGGSSLRFCGDTRLTYIDRGRFDWAGRLLSGNPHGAT
jgi:hypothetical protein